MKQKILAFNQIFVTGSHWQVDDLYLRMIAFKQTFEACRNSVKEHPRRTSQERLSGGDIQSRNDQMSEILLKSH